MEHLGYVKYTRWFKVTFLSPIWRSLNPFKGSLNHPKKVTKNCQVLCVPMRSRHWVGLPAAPMIFAAEPGNSLHIPGIIHIRKLLGEAGSAEEGSLVCCAPPKKYIGAFFFGGGGGKVVPPIAQNLLGFLKKNRVSQNMMLRLKEWS